MRIVARQVELAEANAFVAALHRHHEPVTGHRYSVGAEKDGALVGVAIVGRPVAKSFDMRTVVEVLRNCTDGTKNACSFLYGACARVARELGYHRIQTYTLTTEEGTSLRAAGWVDEGEREGGQWGRPGDWSAPAQAILFQRNRTDQPTCGKRRWAKVLRTPSAAPAAGD